MKSSQNYTQIYLILHYLKLYQWSIKLVYWFDIFSLLGTRLLSFLTYLKVNFNQSERSRNVFVIHQLSRNNILTRLLLLLNVLNLRELFQFWIKQNSWFPVMWPSQSLSEFYDEDFRTGYKKLPFVAPRRLFWIACDSERLPRDITQWILEERTIKLYPK